MDRQKWLEALVRSRRDLNPKPVIPLRKADSEGGCGVIGLACSIPVAGRHLLRALYQMRNRGNGKGGGIAAVGLDPTFFGVDPKVLQRDYLVAVAYLDPGVRDRVEREVLEDVYETDHVVTLRPDPEQVHARGLEITPPEVWIYFVRVRPEVRDRFRSRYRPGPVADTAVDDEIVYQTTFRLNRTFYASEGEKRAFVLSHGRNLLILKLVGYGDDVIRCYGLEDLNAYIWIGHHRYPTKGRVWHPGGAHPFLGMHEALVHNGDFANYASMATYLAQRGVYPLFLTDTEVAVLVFDLFHRVYGYPLEYVIEAMAPTTERDFVLLPPERQRVYRWLQAAHIHGSPDGPWFFLVAQSVPDAGAFRLIGITDTSMLRPQVFALQEGEVSIGFAASEKQAIDAALASLADEDHRFWSHADRYWNARGGSHTDGGAFVFTVRTGDGQTGFECTNKFGEPIRVEPRRPPVVIHRNGGHTVVGHVKRLNSPDLTRVESVVASFLHELPGMDYTGVEAFLERLLAGTHEEDTWERVLEVLTNLMDRRYPCGDLKRSVLLSMYDRALLQWSETLRKRPHRDLVWFGWDHRPAPPPHPQARAVVDARGFPPEGERSLARFLVDLYQYGYRRLVVVHARGHRFIGCGFGPGSHGVRIDVYGSSGDYLASGMDGMEIVVHGTGQDQLAQIMKDGKLVVYGDVGQTFMYGAKGGVAYVLGNAAGRPLINAVGRPRVVINGTCLDYLAESFMAGDPLEGGGFVVLNGLQVSDDGEVLDQPTPYPGGNLFSLASGGAIYVRDPRRLVTEDQLNGGAFVPFTTADWELIRPYLEENQRLFGIPVERLLTIEGNVWAPEAVYRKIRPVRHTALMPEEAWVRNSRE